MRHLLAAVVALVLLCPVTMWGANFPLDKVYQSVARLTSFDMPAAHCTVFAVGKGYFLGAAHCAGMPSPAIDGIATQLVEVDEDTDIAVYNQKGNKRPALKLGAKPRNGDELARVGWILEKPTISAFSGILMNVLDEASGEMVVNSPGTGPGVSGGPVVNTRGEFVSIHTSSANNTPYWGHVFSTAYESTAAVTKRYVK